MLHSTASSKLTVFCAAVVVGIGAYWLYLPSLDCGFTFDDHLGVVNNADVDTSRTTAADLWSNDIWGKSLLAHDSHKSWRPLLVFTFRLSHAAADGFDAAAFHLPSLWLHSCVSALLVPLAIVILKCDLETAAFVAATFAVHPVHVEGVSSVVNRAEPLATLFAILARFAFESLVQGYNTSSASLNDDEGKEHMTTQETKEILEDSPKSLGVKTEAAATSDGSALQLLLSKTQSSSMQLKNPGESEVPVSSQTLLQSDGSPPAIFVAGLSWETTAAELEALCVQMLSRELNKSSSSSSNPSDESSTNIPATTGVSVKVDFLTNRSKKSGIRKDRSLGCAVVRLHLPDTPELVLEEETRLMSGAAAVGSVSLVGETTEKAVSLFDKRSMAARWAAAALNGKMLNGRELAVREERVDRRATGFQADRATRAADDALLGLVTNDFNGNDGSTTSDNLRKNDDDVNSSSGSIGDGINIGATVKGIESQNSALFGGSAPHKVETTSLNQSRSCAPSPVPNKVLTMLRRSFRLVARIWFLVFYVSCLLVCLALSVLSKETGLTVGAILIFVDLFRDPRPISTPKPATHRLSKSSTFLQHPDQARTETQDARAENKKSKDDSATAAAEATAVRWHWICVGLRACLLALSVAMYLFARTHVMTPGGLLELPSPASEPHSSSSSSISRGSESSTHRWRIAWERAAWGSISLETSGLIRKAENPYSLLPPRSLASILSLGHLHFRYAWLLVFPRTLSAEYSFDCIPKVSSILDERNLGTFTAYGTLVALWLYALWKPRARRSLSEALTWGCLPFVPASGVLARLGTLLAERLLYLPSIGYCLLLGWLIDAAEEGCATSEDSAEANSVLSPESATTAPKLTSQITRNASNTVSKEKTRKSKRLSILRAVAWLSVALLAQRTRQRIPDWATDWTLFHAAQEACPTSAKTRHQIGQLWLNQRKDTAMALSHFEAAFALDPDFCDSEYSISLARIQLGDFSPATMGMLRRSLHCVYVANSAFVNIQNVWRFLLNQPGGRNNGTLLEDIGDTLAEVVEGAKAQSQEFDHRANPANQANATATASAKGWTWRSWWQMSTWLTGGKTNDGGAKVGGVDFSGFSSVDLDQVSDSSSSTSRGSEGGSSGESGSTNTGVLMSALENLQGAGVAYLNTQKPYDAARTLARGLLLAQQHGGGDLAKLRSSKARKEVPTADYQCRFRYWLARAQVDVAGAAAAAGTSTAAAAVAVSTDGETNNDGTSKTSKGRKASKKEKTKKAGAASAVAAPQAAAPISAATRDAVSEALAEALKHLNVAANPKRCDPVKIATPSAAVREQVRSLARNFS